MHEDFERYKTGLDRVRLTAESKKALTESLRRRRTADRPEIRTRRLRLGAGCRRSGGGVPAGDWGRSGGGGFAYPA